MPAELPLSVPATRVPVSLIVPVVAIRLVVRRTRSLTRPAIAMSFAVRLTALAVTLPPEATVSVPVSCTVTLGPPVDCAADRSSPMPSARVKPLAVKVPRLATALTLVASATFDPALPLSVPAVRIAPSAWLTEPRLSSSSERPLLPKVPPITTEPAVVVSPATGSVTAPMRKLPVTMAESSSDSPPAAPSVSVRPAVDRASPR